MGSTDLYAGNQILQRRNYVYVREIIDRINNISAESTAGAVSQVIRLS